MKVSATVSAGFSALGMIPANLAWQVIPGYQVLEDGQAASVTALISFMFVFVAVKALGVGHATLEWAYVKLSDSEPSSAAGLCFMWLRTLLGRDLEG